MPFIVKFLLEARCHTESVNDGLLNLRPQKVNREDLAELPLHPKDI